MTPRSANNGNTTLSGGATKTYDLENRMLTHSAAIVYHHSLLQSPPTDGAPDDEAPDYGAPGVPARLTFG
jgi:hypothetical protein